jgi:hypothetical protein
MTHASCAARALLRYRCAILMTMANETVSGHRDATMSPPSDVQITITVMPRAHLLAERTTSRAAGPRTRRSAIAAAAALTAAAIIIAALQLDRSDVGGGHTGGSQSTPRAGFAAVSVLLARCDHQDLDRRSVLCPRGRDSQQRLRTVLLVRRRDLAPRQRLLADRARDGRLFVSGRLVAPSGTGGAGRLRAEVNLPSRGPPGGKP